MLEKLEIVQELNDSVLKDEGFVFALDTDGYDSFIILREVYEWGFEIVIFYDTFDLEEDLLTLYENNVVTYKQVVMWQIFRNVDNISKRLSNIRK